MALHTLHPCVFQFQDQSVDIVGSSTDGGASLSGISDPVESSGGGYWAAKFENGRTRDADTGLAWRALATYLAGGSQAINVLLCDRLFAPVTGVIRAPDDHEWTDSYGPDGAAYTASAAPLRATTLTIAGTSELALRGGETFSIQHATWGWRAYRISDVTQTGPRLFAITFRTPLREAITDATPLNFDSPRVQMHLAPGFQVSTAVNIGRYGSCSLSLVEDMRKPAVA